MGIIKKALHSKIDVFVKFESAINMEIKDRIKKKTGFLLDNHGCSYDTNIFIWYLRQPCNSLTF